MQHLLKRSVVLLVLSLPIFLMAQNGMKLNPTKDDLEAIRIVAIKHYTDKKPENWTLFVEELRKGAVFLENDHISIGIWKFESREKDTLLIRQPELTATMYYFGVYIVKRSGKWEVKDDFVEKEKLIIPKK